MGKGMFEDKSKRKRDQGRKNEAIPGDHVLTSFECELRALAALKRRNVLVTIKEDKLMLTSMLRSSLD